MDASCPVARCAGEEELGVSRAAEQRTGLRTERRLHAVSCCKALALPWDGLEEKELILKDDDLKEKSVCIFFPFVFSILASSCWEYFLSWIFFKDCCGFLFSVFMEFVSDMAAALCQRGSLGLMAGQQKVCTSTMFFIPL